MIMADGTPKVIEYNCRFGDPETQPILMRLKSDLVSHCLAALDGALDTEQASWDPRPAVGIVLAAGGYPGSYAKGDAITGLENLGTESAKVFHAGTAIKDDQVVTNGGRVLCATALGNTVAEAQQAAYQLAASVDFKGLYKRSDIAWRAIEREQQG
jgi:phosphoribosylamine--glycine ligase